MGKIQAVADEAGAEAEAFPSSSPAPRPADLAPRSAATSWWSARRGTPSSARCLRGTSGAGCCTGRRARSARSARLPRGRALDRQHRRRVRRERGVARRPGGGERAGPGAGGGPAGGGGGGAAPFAHGPAGGISGSWDELMDRMERELQAALDEAVAGLPGATGSSCAATPRSSSPRRPAGTAPCWWWALAATARSGACCSGRSSSELVRGTPFPLLVQPRPAED